MTSAEAIIYCLGAVSQQLEDGEYHSRVVYDRQGDAHWIAFPECKYDSPRFCSGSVAPFAADLGPYRRWTGHIVATPDMKNVMIT